MRRTQAVDMLLHRVDRRAAAVAVEIDQVAHRHIVSLAGLREQPLH